MVKERRLLVGVAGYQVKASPTRGSTPLAQMTTRKTNPILLIK
jgi:hypothetical protein